jgi:PhzF family phenazine biosynthesis protein
MRLRIIDAFADRPFAGNPAGVVLFGPEGWPAESLMRDIAAELSLPMTAFAHPLAYDPDADWALRWFMPLGEERLCGHATLAVGHALASDGVSGRVRFRTLAGILSTEAAPDGTVTLDFPAAELLEAPVPAGLAEALGVAPVRAWRTGALRDLVVELADETSVRRAAPDLAAVSAVNEREDIRGVTLTAQADPGGDHDIVARFFSPNDGQAEDAVTGSAHTALAPLWAARLGRDELTSLQASPRTGRLSLAVRGDRVLIGGTAVTVLDGQLHLGR